MSFVPQKQGWGINQRTHKLPSPLLSGSTALPLSGYKFGKGAVIFCTPLYNPFLLNNAVLWLA
jgi:hypothetical protein